jgi:hypothetical protein
MTPRQMHERRMDLQGELAAAKEAVRVASEFERQKADEHDDAKGVLAKRREELSAKEQETRDLAEAMSADVLSLLAKNAVSFGLEGADADFAQFGERQAAE